MDRIASYRDYLEKKPGDRFAMYSLALELRKAGRVEEAEAAFGELLDLHPGSGAGWFQLGDLLRDEERYREADAVWRRGLEALRGLDDPEARRSVEEIRRALSEVEDEL